VTVTVRCYGPARREVGRDTIEVHLDEPATVQRLLEALAELPVARASGLAAMLPTCAIAVGDAVVPADHCIDPALAADVALLPPVAGG